MARTDEVIVERNGVKYYSIAAAATYLGKSVATIYVLAKARKLHRYTFPLQGKRRFFKEQDLDAIAQEGPREIPFEMAV